MNLNVISVNIAMKLHRNESKTFRLKKLNIQRHLVAARINGYGISSRLHAQMDDKKPQIAFDIIVLNYAIKKRQKYLVRKTQLPRLDRFLF